MARKLSPEDQEYLAALYRARLAIITGAQSYTIGSRSLTRADLGVINSEIARLGGEQGTRVRRIVSTDW